MTVVCSSRHGSSRSQVDLVAEERKGGSQLLPQLLLDHRHLINDPATELRRNLRKTRIGVIACQTQRDDGNARDARVICCKIIYRPPQNLAVIYPGTKNNLSVNLNAGLEQPLHLRGYI